MRIGLTPGQATGALVGHHSTALRAGISGAKSPNFHFTAASFRVLMVQIRSGLPERCRGLLGLVKSIPLFDQIQRFAVISTVKGKFCVNMPHGHLIKLIMVMISSVELY